jgi:hypothetical protein
MGLSVASCVVVPDGRVAAKGQRLDKASPALVADPQVDGRNRLEMER